MDVDYERVRLIGVSPNEAVRMLNELRGNGRAGVINVTDQPSVDDAERGEEGGTTESSDGTTPFRRTFLVALLNLGHEADSIELSKHMGMKRAALRAQLAGTGNGKIRIKGVLYKQRWDAEKKRNIYSLTPHGRRIAEKYKAEEA
jgi:hypothetical protein